MNGIVCQMHKQIIQIGQTFLVVLGYRTEQEQQEQQEQNTRKTTQDECTRAQPTAPPPPTFVPAVKRQNPPRCTHAFNGVYEVTSTYKRMSNLRPPTNNGDSMYRCAT